MYLCRLHIQYTQNFQILVKRLHITEFIWSDPKITKLILIWFRIWKNHKLPSLPLPFTWSSAKYILFLLLFFQLSCYSLHMQLLDEVPTLSLTPSDRIVWKPVDVFGVIVNFCLLSISIRDFCLFFVSCLSDLICIML